MNKLHEERDRLANEFEDKWHKTYPRGMTVAGYVNSDVPGTCFSSGFDAASEIHQKRIERLEEALKRCLHARQCNAPYGQMEKMPTVHELKTALQEETK